MVHVLSEVSGYGFEGCKAGKGSTAGPGCDTSSHSTTVAKMEVTHGPAVCTLIFQD